MKELRDNPTSHRLACPLFSKHRTIPSSWAPWERSLRRGTKLLDRSHKINCSCQAVKAVKTKELPRKEVLRSHKLFDEVTIRVRAGSGGQGEITQQGKGRTVRNFKYKPGGRQPKEIWLPAGDPADGAKGGDVLLVVDPALDNLLHLRARSEYHAPDGAKGNPTVGSMAPLRQKIRAAGKADPLRIAVPPGTVVKRKRGGQLLGELLQPGQTLVVARGGRGGLGVQTPGPRSQSAKSRQSPKMHGVEEYEIEDRNFKDDLEGQPGEEVALELLLRVVADIGIVGLPNAGKSSLLAALTRASPEVADYPFTTLTPNLGVLSSSQVSAGDLQEFEVVQSSRPVLADLPGLIEGAHIGRGLGRLFLRHLRRTNAILHVLDAAADDPISDYWVVREELRMYNAEYCQRPHIVALNKMDLEDAAQLEEELTSGVRAKAQQLKEEGESAVSVPGAIIPTSAFTGRGIEDLSSALCQLAKANADG